MIWLISVTPQVFPPYPQHFLIRKLLLFLMRRCCGHSSFPLKVLCYNAQRNLTSASLKPHSLCRHFLFLPSAILRSFNPIQPLLNCWDESDTLLSRNTTTNQVVSAYPELKVSLGRKTDTTLTSIHSLNTRFLFHAFIQQIFI